MAEKLIQKQELIDIPVDLWLLGHTHVAYPVSEKVFNHKIFNAGAPEADGLDFGGKGSAWIIELSEDRSVAHKIETGMYEFFDKSFNVSSREDLEKIKAWALSDNPKLKLVRIDLSGSLSEGVLVLRALVDLSDKSTVNVNILTHLKYPRIKKLIELGKSFKDANTQAQTELLKLFGLQKYASKDVSQFSKRSVGKNHNGRAKQRQR